ncbi:MAG: T9SS type A sorting domain-containing protein [Ginsengibacter sp.]
MKFFCTNLRAGIVKNLRPGKSVSLILLLAFIFFGTVLKAQSRIYLSNDDHTDYMFSADEAGYDTLFVNMIDAWMANNNATSTNPPDYQTRFNCDGTYWAWVYARKKTPAQFQAFVNQLNSEKIVMPMNALISTYGCVPAEATIRGMYYAGELKKKYNIPFDMVMCVENQVMPLGLASIWKGCGAKYAWHGVCNCSTKIPDLLDNREKEIFWYKGLDDSGVIMKWYTKTADHALGNYSEARNPATAIADLTAKVNTPNYNYNIAGAFGVGGDRLQILTDELSAAAKNSSNISRRLIVSNQVDFFRDFEKNYGATLPKLTQSYGNEWEHGCASLAEVSANVKRSLEKLRSAEAMATIVSGTDPFFAHTLDSMRREAWMALGAYWEHNFEGNGPNVTNDKRAAWEKKMQQNFTGYVNQLYALSLSRLANQITKTSANKRFFVFNPLSWTRTDYADIAYTGNLPAHIMDVSTNTEVPSQVISKDGSQYMRVLAAGVPSVGYKVFEIVNGAGSTFTNAATIDNTTRTIDNAYFTIAFTNNGVITGLLDKTNGNKQLASAVSSSDYINNLSRNSVFEGNSNTGGSFVIDNTGPVSMTVKFTSTATINHETLITVFKDIPRVEIDNKITQNFNNDLLSSTFSFNASTISSPGIWHEENGAVINAKKISSGGHYADRQARYDLLTLNHFAAISSNGNYGVTLSNQDCYFMQTGNSTVSTLDENTAKIKVLIGGRVDGLGMNNQDHDAVFSQRYAISAYNTYSPVTSMKSSLEHQNGFVSAEITNTAGILPANNFSFLTISNANTLLWALKPAEEGVATNGLVMRVWNLTNARANTDFIFNDNIMDAKNITHIETDISDASFSDQTVSTAVAKYQMKSYRVKLAAGGPLPIEISNFTGIRQNDINDLSWNVQEVSNLAHYNIERGLDSNSFDSIAIINATGSTTYGYDDGNIDPLSSYYYRLKLVRKDGSFLYSDIIFIKADKHVSRLVLFPNPVQSELGIRLILDKQSRYDVWINDISGKRIMKLPSRIFEAGNNNFTINTGYLPRGTYTLVVRGNGLTYIRKFIKN